MFFLIGSVVVVVCVVVGFLMAGGNLLLLWHPSEIIVICGAALGAQVLVRRAHEGAQGRHDEHRVGH